ncbi:hypothetical protein RchiOBHm_Chr2g0131841 [Rosa chinensis]|uniref:Uncharacterized protein n=1 Tax=Rosa chinensis TaxID=74649 RepID=A0A2P6RV67_ROSCH|nr:hypothetical protein RchiOBHm_Chr2g0131841 [Rosa chinensis]
MDYECKGFTNISQAVLPLVYFAICAGSSITLIAPQVHLAMVRQSGQTPLCQLQQTKDQLIRRETKRGKQSL